MSPAPIFVIGSPRSGTSILTWCLGQHPNILPLEESFWMGAFAADVGAAHLRGTVRAERSPFGMLGVSRADCFAAFGACIDDLIRAHRGRLCRNSDRVAERDPAQVHASFGVVRHGGEPKSRWVDGTPEHSFHVCGLHRLFPHARFVHIARGVDDVVESMLRFCHDDGSPLVPDRRAAVDYWLRAARACSDAEQALGPDVVLRVRYDDLCRDGAGALRRILAFLGEAHAPACVDALAVRVGRSAGARLLTDAADAEDTALLEQARAFSDCLQRQPQPATASPAVRAEFEAAFDRHVQFVEGLDAEYARVQRIAAQNADVARERTAWAQRRDRDFALELRRHTQARTCALLAELVTARRLLAGVAVGAGIAGLLQAGFGGTLPGVLLLSALAIAAAGGYVWLRRKGLAAALASLRMGVRTRQAEAGIVDEASPPPARAGGGCG